MRMHEVSTNADKKTFLEIAVSMYAGDPNYVRPLDKDIEEVFDLKKNKFFKKGECTRWLLLNDNNQPVGRIAAFVNHTYKQDQPTGGIGFFECSNNQQAANFMLDHCKAWLQQRGMEAMDGPINFGERDKWWGIIVEGFSEPLYGMTYNLPYYKNLLEAYGFQVYYDQVCFSLPINSQLSEKFFKRHDAIAKHKDYRVEHVKKSQVEKYARDFATVYNAAWASHGGGKSLEESQAIKLFQTMKPVMDEKVVWFTYYQNHPIAMWINLPDLNQFFKHLNGKFGLLQKLKFLYLQHFGTCSRLVGIVFGVVPRFQGKGIDTYMIVEASKVMQDELNYTDYEMQWIGDFNPKMINIAESLGTKRSRMLSTYRYFFDRSKEFKRHPAL